MVMIKCWDCKNRIKGDKTCTKYPKGIPEEVHNECKDFQDTTLEEYFAMEKEIEMMWYVDDEEGY